MLNLGQLAAGLRDESGQNVLKLERGVIRPMNPESMFDIEAQPGSDGRGGCGWELPHCIFFELGKPGAAG